MDNKNNQEREKDQANTDNRANQLNPNNEQYHKSRGEEVPLGNENGDTKHKKAD